MTLAKREFDETDQKRFAVASGDHNPMHVDEIRARRTQAGAPTVHGIHLLLWALDSFASSRSLLPPLHNFRVRFDKFVYVNESVAVQVSHQGLTDVRLNLTVDGAPRSTVTLEFGDPIEYSPEWAAAGLALLPISTVPADVGFSGMSDRCGRIPFQMTAEAAVALFPFATRWLGVQRIAALAASTYLVGMVLPGMHSIYSELSISVCSDDERGDALSFRVTKTDARFHSIQQEIAGGGICGTIRCFVRSPPVQQPTMEALKGVVGPGEFAGSLALVVGGSRGLGELTAKLIATGGGRVILTWKAGKEDAERVAHEIRQAGGICETLAYDAQALATEQLSHLSDTPTHAYYFATPNISRPQSEIFVAERLKDFMRIYVDGFWQLAQALRARQPKLSLFYPSSIFLTKRPRKMTEYTMAKAAGEVLCADMNVSFAPLHVTVSRLPRLATDQTTSLIAMERAHPLETLGPIVREVQSWPR